MRHPRLLLIALIALTLTIGILDYLTGPRLSFSLFYLAPVTMAGWLLGVRASWVLTAAASLAQLSADFAWDGQELSLITLWNAFTRISVLGALGHLVAWLRRDRDRLDQLLAQRTSAHVATVDQLRHRDRLALVGQIASGLAHELGTPLNIVDGRARLMGDTDLTPVERSAHVRSILEQTERMTRIIRQLLDFARRRGPDIGRVDVHELCGRVLELLRPLASKRAVELKLLPAEGDCAAAVDYNHIQQAITNLVMNAVQAMPDGGNVTVRICGLTGEALILSVSDTGMGIAEEHVARIFEPFFTTQGAGQGTGLGLSITEGIVKDHGGTIEVTSKVGCGSRFTLRLPRTQGPKPSERP